MARLWRELRHGPHGRDRYLVAGALVSLTGSGPSPEVHMVLPGPGGLGFRWRMGGRVLGNEDAAGTLGRIGAGQVTLALLPRRVDGVERYLATRPGGLERGRISVLE
jgi:hypothetical protein